MKRDTTTSRLSAVIAALCMSVCLVACTPSNSSPTADTETSVTGTEVTASSEVDESSADEQTDASSATEQTEPTSAQATAFNLNDVPAYSGEPAVEVNGNKPYFDEAMLDNAKQAVQNGTKMFENDNEYYMPLDELGRCQAATGLLSTETMPPEGEERDGIGMIKPAGWHTAKYPDVIKDLYLYNRCHLIGWQLGNENANELNLTTGTRYVNVDGMLPYENETADYMRTTGNHVLYRVTPIFVDNELVCRGILMEAQSIEDDDCTFCVYCYDVQPYIHIDYLTGDSYQITTEIDNEDAEYVTNGEDIPEQDLTIYDQYIESDFVLNTKSKKIHKPDCESVKDMNPDNRKDVHTTINSLLNDGYEPCKNCNP